MLSVMELKLKNKKMKKKRNRKKGKPVTEGSDPYTKIPGATTAVIPYTKKQKPAKGEEAEGEQAEDVFDDPDEELDKDEREDLDFDEEFDDDDEDMNGDTARKEDEEEKEHLEKNEMKLKDGTAYTTFAGDADASEDDSSHEEGISSEGKELAKILRLNTGDNSDEDMSDDMEKSEFHEKRLDSKPQKAQKRTETQTNEKNTIIEPKVSAKKNQPTTSSTPKPKLSSVTTSQTTSLTTQKKPSPVTGTTVISSEKKPPSKQVAPPTAQPLNAKPATPKASTVASHKRPLESDNLVATQPAAKKQKANTTTITTTITSTTTSTSSNTEPPNFTEQDLINVLEEHGSMKIADFLTHFRGRIGKSSQQQKYFKAYATKVTKVLTDGNIGLKENLDL